MDVVDVVVIGAVIVAGAMAWWFALIRPVLRYIWGRAPIHFLVVWIAEAFVLLIAASLVLYPAATSIIAMLGPFAIVLALIPIASGWSAYLINGPQYVMIFVGGLMAIPLWRTGGMIRTHAMLLAIPVGLLAGLGAGEVLSRKAMAREALRIGADCVARQSYLHSVLASGYDHAITEPHAYAIAKGTEYFWSYYQARFVPADAEHADGSYAIEVVCRSALPR